MTNLPEWANSAAAAAVSVAGTFLVLRRKWSKDSSGIVEDRAQNTLITTLLRERDAALLLAKEAWSQRTDDAKAIARFEALMEAAERETKRLRDELFAIRLHTRKLTAIIVRLDPQAAALLQVDGDSDGIGESGRRSSVPMPPVPPTHVIVDNKDPVPVVQVTP